MKSSRLMFAACAVAIAAAAPAAEEPSPVVGNPISALTGRPGHFRKSSVQLQNAAGTLDLWIVAKGGGDELCRIDWFTFRP